MAPTRDPRVDAYIQSTPDFARPILERIRAAFHAGCPDLVETMKWSRPHFEHHGLLGGMSAFKAHVTWGFWRGKEIGDPHGILAEVGDTKMGACRVESLRDLPSRRVLVEYVKLAAKANEIRGQAPARKNGPAGKRRARPAPRPPADLLAALKKSARARKTFDGFPPSKKREYVEWITDAKRDETRARRLKQAVEWMAEGKSRNWKYESC